MWPSALAHALPIEPGEAGHPTLLIALLAVGTIGAYALGLALGNRLALDARRRSWLRAASFGAIVFLLFDLLKESASLGQSLVRDPVLLGAILVAFALGALFIPATLRAATPARLALLWTLGIGLHGAGEGIVIGTEAPTATLTGVLGILSFLLHKGIEGATVPFVAGAPTTRRGVATLATLTGAIVLLAAFVGLVLYRPALPLLFFAAGAGASVYALLRLGEGTSPTLRTTVAALAGVLVVLAAGLLHEV